MAEASLSGVLVQFAAICVQYSRSHFLRVRQSLCPLISIKMSLSTCEHKDFSTNKVIIIYIDIYFFKHVDWGLGLRFLNIKLIETSWVAEKAERSL